MKKYLILLYILIITLLFSEEYYIVQRGDTLFSIARDHGISVNFLQDNNNIQDASRIFVGQRLSLKASDYHTVKRGDTLYGIARKYSMSLVELLGLNDLSTSYVLKVGDRILITKSQDKAEKDLPEDSESSLSSVSSSKEDSENGKVSEKEQNMTFAVHKLHDQLWPIQGDIVQRGDRLNGVEILGRKSETVQSISTGKVVFVGPYRGFGHVVIVESNQRYLYTYAGQSEVFVKEGEYVEPGASLGVIGLDPFTSEARLIFFVYRDGVAVSPMNAPRL